MDKISLRQALENPELILNEEESFGFFDWFCRESTLQVKAKSLFAEAKKISCSSKINQDTQYISFKNNCSIKDGLYDTLRILDMETSDVIYSIIPPQGKIFGQIWGRENNFEGPLLETYNINEIYDFFGV